MSTSREMEKQAIEMAFEAPTNSDTNTTTKQTEDGFMDFSVVEFESKKKKYCMLCTIISTMIWILFLFLIICLPKKNFLNTNIGDEAILSDTKSAFMGHSCRLTFKNFVTHCRLNGIWLFYHFCLYIWISCIIRSRFVLYSHSILWEIIGYGLTVLKGKNYKSPPLQWMYECLFDRIIIDILIFNLIGIELGLVINKIIYKKYNDRYKFKWFFYYHKNIENAIIKCTHNISIWFITVLISVWFMVIEVANRFIIAYVALYINEIHWIMCYRILTFTCLMFHCIMELNRFLSIDDKVVDIKEFLMRKRWAYLLICVLFLESIIIIKYYFL